MLWGMFSFRNMLQSSQKLQSKGFPENISMVSEFAHSQTLGIAQFRTNYKYVS